MAKFEGVEGRWRQEQTMNFACNSAWFVLLCPFIVMFVVILTLTRSSRWTFSAKGVALSCSIDRRHVTKASVRQTL